MKKITFTIFFVLFFLHGLAQQVHVKYYHVRSPIATLYEDLYIKDNDVISIQDSIINFNSNGTISAVKSSSKPISKNYFISKLKDEKSKDFFFTGLDRETKYFIHDNVSKPIWKIDETKTKKILGYSCIKATTNFRGSELTAYFTKELPYSAGPFKFFGLPGLILDIREENKNFNIWKAEKVELSVDPLINFTPKLNNYPKITMKEFIELKDGSRKKETEDLLSRMPPGTKVQSESKGRAGLEKKFEFEQMYAN
ncbi:GLPGLI family protein [Chryseobacterium sp. PMSZPI]|uniref:GLPGLI family protein n=1 Tax=Chryseobacterium sp. PMSZPI TaxID=1033900 RepID=UPI00399EF622